MRGLHSVYWAWCGTDILRTDRGLESRAVTCVRRARPFSTPDRPWLPAISTSKGYLPVGTPGRI